jgi:hypothetical protein
VLLRSLLPIITCLCYQTLTLDSFFIHSFLLFVPFVFRSFLTRSTTLRLLRFSRACNCYQTLTLQSFVAFPFFLPSFLSLQFRFLSCCFLTRSMTLRLLRFSRACNCRTQQGWNNWQRQRVGGATAIVTFICVLSCRGGATAIVTFICVLSCRDGATALVTFICVLSCRCGANALVMFICVLFRVAL